MEGHEKLSDQIDQLTIPYKNIFTTVYLIRTDGCAVLFDAASYASDIEDYVLPWLEELGVTEQMLRYVFISHNHTDHAGGLSRLMEVFPEAIIVSRSRELREKFCCFRFFLPEDGDVLVDSLRVVTIPGHSMDSMALYDRKRKYMITGDSLQLRGIFGSDFWGANISWPAEHLQALEKLQEMDVRQLLWSHDYYPMGRGAAGREEILAALDACRAPLIWVWGTLRDYPELDDETIRGMYNASGKVPMMGRHVVTAVRTAMEQGKL